MSSNQAEKNTGLTINRSPVLLDHYNTQANENRKENSVLAPILIEASTRLSLRSIL